LLYFPLFLFPSLAGFLAVTGGRVRPGFGLAGASMGHIGLLKAKGVYQSASIIPCQSRQKARILNVGSDPS
jgi:hypothetical protein